MTNARASWNVIFTQSVYLYNCPLFEATRAKCLQSDEKTYTPLRKMMAGMIGSKPEIFSRHYHWHRSNATVLRT